jgi:hypothetical protein
MKVQSFSLGSYTPSAGRLSSVVVRTSYAGRWPYIAIAASIDAQLNSKSRLPLPDVNSEVMAGGFACN